MMLALAAVRLIWPETVYREPFNHLLLSPRASGKPRTSRLLLMLELGKALCSEIL